MHYTSLAHQAHQEKNKIFFLVNTRQLLLNRYTGNKLLLHTMEPLEVLIKNKQTNNKLYDEILWKLRELYKTIECPEILLDCCILELN